MATRLDVKNILSIFNESRLQADQNAQKERLAALNRELEERKMADEADYRNKSIGIQQAEQEANARFREGSLAEQARQTDMQAQWHKDEVTQQGIRDAALAQYYKDQVALGYAQLGTKLDKNGRPLSAEALKQQSDEAFKKTQGAFQSDFWNALKGGVPDGKGGWTAPEGGWRAIDLNADPIQGVNMKDPKAVMAHMERLAPALQAAARVVQKYKTEGFDADAYNLPLIKQLGKFASRISGENAFTWGNPTSGYSAPAMIPFMGGAAPLGQFGEPKRTVDQSRQFNVYNQLDEVNALISQWSAANAQQQGLKLDPKSHMWMQQ